jgi:hypothetical protein
VRGSVPTEAAPAIHTAAALIGELVAARHATLTRSPEGRGMTDRLDKVGYVPPADALACYFSSLAVVCKLLH